MDNEKRNKMKGHGVSNSVYGLGFIGAAVYFVQHATGFWVGVLGIIKAIFWPVVLIYNLLDFLKL